MKKIPALIHIDRVNHVPTEELNPDAVWIINHPNVIATRKRDGQPVKFMGGDPADLNNWTTRRAVAPGKTAPTGFILEETDPNTGKSFGWEPVNQSGVTKAFKKALVSSNIDPEVGQTFELCGPKVQGDAENLGTPMLFAHGKELVDMPTLAEMAASGDLHGQLKTLAMNWKSQGSEGVVFWADGIPAVKVRTKDFIF